MNIYEFTFRSIEDATLSLERWQGQPILMVNTASECGFTPQYEKLQKLYHEYHPAGLVVLGVPSNDFGGQEPSPEHEIRAFCRSNFGVAFPMTARQTFSGPDAHPLFVAMVEEFTEAILPRWNFTKYLFGKDGGLVEHWPSETEPDDSEFRRSIEQNLSAWRL